ncbi:MAG: hypothetical protein KDC58_11495 [Cyclobacteriaceae bacterium]|nr:hypothetical protein [Cyclobacteriaceae bacterium]
MSFEFSTNLKEGYLTISAKGLRKDFDSMISSSKGVSEIAIKNKVKYILLDYNELYYDVPLTFVYNQVKVFERNLPYLSQITISVITNRESYEIAKFWESICIKRGYRYKVFLESKLAVAWLKEQITLDKTRSSSSS